MWIALICFVIFFLLVFTAIKSHDKQINIPAEHGLFEYEYDFDVLGVIIPGEILYEAEKGDPLDGTKDRLLLYDILLKRDYKTDKELEYALLEQLKWEAN